VNFAEQWMTVHHLAGGSLLLATTVTDDLLRLIGDEIMPETLISDFEERCWRREARRGHVGT